MRNAQNTKPLRRSTALAVCALALCQLAAAQPIPSMKGWRSQVVQVAKDCTAHSMRPQDPEEMTIEWRGPCDDGMAHGDGALVIRMQAIPVSISKMRYSDGQPQSMNARYYFELGVLYFRPDTKSDPARVDDLSQLPTWAEDLKEAAPRWAEWRRLDTERRHGERRGVSRPKPVRPKADEPRAVEEEQLF